MNRIAYFIIIFYGSLILGYTLKKAGILKETLAPKITRVIIRIVSPAILVLSFWSIKLSGLKILTLPFVGLGVSVMCILPAFVYTQRLKFDRPKAGAFIISSLFSNVGYPLGAFLCFILFGERGFGLALIYCLYWSALFYSAGFYIASKYGAKVAEKCRTSDVGHQPKEAGEEIKAFPVAGMVIGLLLNLTGISRPVIFSNLNSALIPISTAGFLFSSGLTLRFSRLKQHIRPALFISFIKFLYAPLIGFTLASLLGYGDIMDGVALKVVLIESCMPVAISCMIIPQLFGLDQDLANSLWLWTTFLLIPILPVLIAVVRFIG